ncbi:hypothetical protein B0H19DRAFT_1378619 [Mycena capillaripes]|nr:hypothetical protein B0H19DRAFT_1378619 [Mycena capillaripes]
MSGGRSTVRSQCGPRGSRCVPPRGEDIGVEDEDNMAVIGALARRATGATDDEPQDHVDEIARVHVTPAGPSSSEIETDSNPPSPIISPPSLGGRPRRRVRLPKRYRDEPPAPPTIVEPPVVPPIDPTPPAGPNTEEEPPKWVKTEPNIHGLYKVSPNRPTHHPDESASLDDLCKSSELLVGPKSLHSHPRPLCVCGFLF